MNIYVVMYFDGEEVIVGTYEDRDRATERVREILAEIENEEGILASEYEDLVAEVGYSIGAGDDDVKDTWKGQPTYVAGREEICHVMYAKSKLRLG